MTEDKIKKTPKEIGAYLKKNPKTGTYSWDQVD